MKLVVVDWVDSSGCRGWRPVSEAVPSEPVMCRSVGWVLAERKDTLVIAAHFSGQEDAAIETCVRGDMAIPRKCIRRITVLRGK